MDQIYDGGSEKEDPEGDQAENTKLLFDAMGKDPEESIVYPLQDFARFGGLKDVCTYLASEAAKTHRNGKTETTPQQTSPRFNSGT